MPRACLGPALACLIACGATVADAQEPTTATAARTPFASRSRTFRLELPAGWRQLAPGEVAAVVAAVPQLPADVAKNEPTLFYAVGAVDDWLRGAFDGTYLYVVEQDNEWVLDDQVGERLAAMWAAKGRHDGVDYAVAQVERRELGADRHAVVTSVRTITPRTGRAQRCLDVHIASGGREVTLCLAAWAEDFDRLRPQFEAWLQTLTLARKARGEATLADRLWTPLLTGAIVGLLLVLLWRHTRSRV